MKKLPKARSSDVIIQRSGKEVLIYDLKLNKAHCLNEASSLVWELCDGKTRVRDITDRLSEYFGKAVSIELVWLAIDQLKKAGLLKNGEELEANFTGVSRREAIREIGFASVIGVPIVSSILAPVAATAQSVCENTLNPCVFTNFECCPGLNCIPTATRPFVSASNSTTACCDTQFSAIMPGVGFCAPSCGSVTCCSGNPGINAPTNAICGTGSTCTCA